jgi:hypothetical protein
MAAGLARFGLIVHFPINVFENGFGLRIRTGFGKFSRSFCFFLGLFIDLFQVLLGG